MQQAHGETRPAGAGGSQFERHRDVLWPRGAVHVSGHRILVVDDEEEVRGVLKEALEHAGYVVLVARNGREAISLQRQRPADLIITDIFMPEPEGVETIIELREKYPAVKLVSMSGLGRLGTFGYLFIARRLGVSRSIRKPFSTDDVVAAVSQLLASPEQGPEVKKVEWAGSRTHQCRRDRD